MSYRYDVAYENLTKDPVDGVLACGFLKKEPEVRGHHFVYYGGFLILSGKGEYRDEDGNVIEIGVGDFVQRRPGKKHTTTVKKGEPWVEFYVCFGMKLYQTLTSMGIISDEPVLHITNSTEVQKRCESLLYAFKKAKETDRINLLLQVQSFIFYMNALHNEQKIHSGAEMVINDICAELSKDYKAKIDLKVLAKNHQMGYENLRKIFKQRTGISLYHYRVIKRINEAKRLLVYKDYSLKSIADDLGYTDQYAFSNQFKKVVGMSPKIFRENM